MPSKPSSPSPEELEVKAARSEGGAINRQWSSPPDNRLRNGGRSTAECCAKDPIESFGTIGPNGAQKAARALVQL
jgi:hypothetical protein